MPLPDGPSENSLKTVKVEPMPRLQFFRAGPGSHRDIKIRIVVVGIDVGVVEAIRAGISAVGLGLQGAQIETGAEVSVFVLIDEDRPAFSHGRG